MTKFTQEKYPKFISTVEKFVVEHCENLDTAHDWDHVNRVRNLATLLYKKNSSDVEKYQDVELIALLHDVGDFKFGYDQRALVGGFLAPILNDSTLTDFDEETAEKKLQFILEQISHVSWRKGLKSESEPTSENSESQGTFLHQYVSDADRLDAMGYIGVARCFSYGGSRHSKLYDYSVAPDLHLTRESYDKQTDVLADGQPIDKRSKNNCINHFHEKLLKLKDSLKTEQGKKLGEIRHKRLVEFVEGFKQEVELLV